MSFRFKVCGLTEERSLEAAVDAGADAVGFNFYPQSPRFVPASRARSLVEQLPSDVVPVGVFVNRPLDQVLEWMDESGVAWAQFHGDEQPEDLAVFPRPWYPALRPTRDDPLDVSVWSSPFVLLDARADRHYGGTGRTADWGLARHIARRHEVVLAGGLGPANLEQALEAVRPAGVDLNSGVESAPGIKDPALLERAGVVIAAWAAVREGEA